MDINVTTESNVTVFAVIGQLDAITSPELEERLGHWFEQPGSSLVFDLEGLDYISSAGLRIILSADKKMKARNGKLCLARPRSRVKEAFKISGFISIIPAFDTLPEALAAAK